MSEPNGGLVISTSIEPSGIFSFASFSPSRWPAGKLSESMWKTLPFEPAAIIRFIVVARTRAGSKSAPKRLVVHEFTHGITGDQAVGRLLALRRRVVLVLCLECGPS